MLIGGQLIKFGLVGGLNTGIHYLVFLLLMRFGVPLLPASTVGYLVGLVNSFVLNRSWTFRVEGGERRIQFVRFVVVNLIALGFNLVALEMLVTGLGLAPSVAQILAIGASLLVNFTGNRWWVFRGSARGSVPVASSVGTSHWRESMKAPARSDLRSVLVILFLAFVIAFALKVSVVDAGAPHVTIDDVTQYEGGFLVWFGQAPPQRMYVESWLNGLSSIATYAVGQVMAGQASSLGLNLVADAYADFHAAPDRYVAVYRRVALTIDLLTAFLVFLFARTALATVERRNLLASAVATFYLLSFNTIWCFVVARPDTATALLASVGLLFYYRSDFGVRRTDLVMSGLAFGLAAGMKLHGAFFVLFFIADLVRVHGPGRAYRLGWPLVVVSLAAFAVSAGSPLFDPLLYAKLRLLNAKDDESPWIQWGHQFLVIIRGTGFLIVPLCVLSMIDRLRPRTWRRHDRVVSAAFVLLLWLLLFSSIRQLRAYWMLPTLPLFYLVAVDGLRRLPGKTWQGGLLAVILGLMVWQCVEEVRTFRNTPYDQLRSWVSTNIAGDEPIYILGYEALELPKSPACREITRTALQRSLTRARDEGDSFTLRHVEDWEERSRLVLLDMLAADTRGKHSYFSVHEAPLDEWDGIIDRTQFRYVLLQQGFDLETEPGWGSILARDFELVAEVVGPGGAGRGLRYRIMERTSP